MSWEENRRERADGHVCLIFIKLRCRSHCVCSERRVVFAFANCTQHNPTGSSRSPRDDWPGIAEVSAVVYAGPENVPVEGSARNEVLNAAWGRYWFSGCCWLVSWHYHRVGFRLRVHEIIEDWRSTAMEPTKAGFEIRWTVRIGAELRCYRRTMRECPYPVNVAQCHKA